MKNGTEMVIRPAATVMVFRENNGLEVLLLKRNHSLKFAPDYWVFPGGRIDENELDKFSSEEEAAREAGTRESWEESRLRIDPDKMFPYYHWTTPAGGTRRFGTWFYHAEISFDRSHVIIDNSEIIDYKWLSPAEALLLQSKGKLLMLPPTFISLQRVKKLVHYHEVVREFYRTGIIKVKPVVSLTESTLHSLYEGDAGYDTGDPLKAGPRHRLIAQIHTGHYSFEYKDCDHVTPITGGIPLDESSNE